ncbi:TetR/AcrR family transcriptional regulator [Actinocorallia lasiicapitis]
MSSDTRPLRADAERNRRRVLNAAAELFAEQGLEVTLDDIARHAGVGVGTVYRRFANREALVDELFEEKLVQLVTIAEQALTEPDPWLALSGFLTGMCTAQAGDRGLREIVLGGSHGSDRVRRTRERLMPIGRTLIERAQAAGVVRADLNVTDMPIIAFTIATVADYTGAIAPEAWRRQLAFVLDGLRTPEPAELTAPPLTVDQVDVVMRGWRPPRR